MGYRNDNFKNERQIFNGECYFIQDYLSAYMNNELSNNEKKVIKKHLNLCPSCNFEYESLTEFRNTLQKNINDKDIQKLFKNKHDKKTRKIFENFLTYIFAILLTTSITCLIMSFF